MNEKKTLKLTLKKKVFDVMVTGEKAFEFRRPSKWIRSRLFSPNGDKRKYDFVQFVNGCGSDRPYFVAKYKGFERALTPFEKSYSNGLIVSVRPFDIIIKLGAVVKTGNFQDEICFSSVNLENSSSLNASIKDELIYCVAHKLTFIERLARLSYLLGGNFTELSIEQKTKLIDDSSHVLTFGVPLKNWAFYSSYKPL